MSILMVQITTQLNYCQQGVSDYKAVVSLHQSDAPFWL